MSDNPKIHFDLPTGVQATDLTQVFTSKPYPVIVIDAMTVRGSIRTVRSSEGFVDGTAPSAFFSEITTHTVLFRDYSDGAPEGVDSTGFFGEIASREVLFEQITMDPEGVDSTAFFIGIESGGSDVDHTQPPENLDATGFFVSIEST